MKLACLRCKRKKIKCDKSEPTCHQCITAKAECQYVERRQRPRLAQQQKLAAASLNQRLELLEKQISNVGGHAGSASQQSRSPSTPLTTSTSGIIDQVTAANLSLVGRFQATENAEDSWIYRMANNTKKQFQSQATPISTPTPQIETDMSALNEALEDLAQLRLRADLKQGNVILAITIEEAKQCLEAFFEMMDTLVVPGIFATTFDTNLLRSFPYIVDSAYVHVDPGVHVLYFAAIHYGLTQIRGPGHALAQTAYLKALEHVPAWLESSTETDMDGYTAAIIAWVAVNNLDYQLSWKFHLKACHYLKSRGIDNLDIAPARTMEEEEKKEPTRYLYWQVLSTDCLFRLFWHKPTILQWTSKKVRPPAILSPWNLHPGSTQAMLICVWISYTSRTIEQISSIDEASSQGLSVSHDVNECCLKLEATIVEWKLEAMMRDTTIRFTLRCVVADHIMNIYAVIVGLKRSANRVDKIDVVDALTIRAARKIVGILLDFDQDGSGTPDKPVPENYFINFINFYPFCAVFTLYEYVMACTDPADCEEDVSQLERIGDAMEHSSKVFHSDLKPFTKTIKALNKVSRTLQESRRNQRPASPEEQGGGTNSSQHQTINHHAIDVLPDLDPTAFEAIPDFPMTLDGEPDPLGFVRAMENDFIGRNWNENWWHMGGAMDSSLDNDVNYPPGSAVSAQQQAAYMMPSPNT